MSVCNGFMVTYFFGYKTTNDVNMNSILKIIFNHKFNPEFLKKQTKVRRFFNVFARDHNVCVVQGTQSSSNVGIDSL